MTEQNKIYSDINLGILRNAPTGKKILDVGCGSGILGADLKKLGNYVYGIDISDEELAMARNRLNEVKKIDLARVGDLSIPKDFDLILFADILEHLADPLAALAKLKNHLKDDGEVIISLPNVACWNMRLGLLFGQFNYKDYGLLDATHLRFFTKKSAKRLVRDAGFKISKIDVTPFFIRPLFRFYRNLFHKKDAGGVLEEETLKSPAFRIYRQWIFPVERLITRIWPTLLAYQFIIVANKHE